MIPYIIYTAVITAICFLFYRLLLHRETFFALNRWFFLFCLLGSFALPLVHVPGGWSLRTQVLAKLNPSERVEKIPAISQRGSIESEDPDASGLLVQKMISTPSPRVSKEAIALPAASSARIYQSASSEISPISTTAPREERSPVTLSQILNWLYYTYLIGALIFGAILLLQIILLIYQVINNPVARDGLFRIVQTNGNRAPCSFGHYIFINPALYDEETFLQILSHEKIHAQQRHSFDIMLAELCIVVQWFNPFAWFYRKALEDNLEFLTDAAMIRNPQTDASHYQMSLVRVAAPYLPLSITSNYNQSLLKKRMIMMHIQKSSVRTTWKYLFLLPLLTGMVCIFNDTAAVSQNVNPPKTQQQAVKTVVGSGNHSQTQAVDSTRTAAEPAPAANFSGNTKPKSNLSGDDTDNDASVVVNPVTSVNIQTTVNPIVHTDPLVNVNVETNVNAVTVVVPPLNVNSNFAQPDQRKGTWMASIHGDTVELTLRSEQEEGYRGYSTNTETMKKSEFSSLPRGQKADFTVTREAGILSLNGVFDGDEGFGHYTFKENTEFQNYLDKAGITGVTEKRMFGVFFANVTKAYVEEIAQAGYPHMTINNLIGMSSMEVKAPFIQSWKQLGYSDLEPHDLIALKSMNIDGTYLKELQSAGFKDIPLHDLVGAKSMGIDAAYIQTWKQAGFTDFPIREIISAKSVGIDPSYVQSWKQAGFADISIRDLISAKSMSNFPTNMTQATTK